MTDLDLKTPEPRRACEKKIIEEVILINKQMDNKHNIFDLSEKQMKATAKAAVGRLVTKERGGPVIGKIQSTRIEGNKIIGVIEEVERLEADYRKQLDANVKLSEEVLALRAKAEKLREALESIVKAVKNDFVGRVNGNYCGNVAQSALAQGHEPKPKICAHCDNEYTGESFGIGEPCCSEVCAEELAAQGEKGE